MIPQQNISDAFRVIQELASLCATSGVSAPAKDIANEQIEALLLKIIKPSVQELTARSSGLITK